MVCYGIDKKSKDLCKKKEPKPATELHEKIQKGKEKLYKSKENNAYTVRQETNKEGTM
jgi:hypothetical protein